MISTDYITIYDINDDGNTVISSLTGPDSGPHSVDFHSRWQKKIISSTSNKMLVEFRSYSLNFNSGEVKPIYITANIK